MIRSVVKHRKTKPYLNFINSKLYQRFSKINDTGNVIND